MARGQSMWRCDNAPSVPKLGGIAYDSIKWTNESVDVIGKACGTHHSR